MTPRKIRLASRQSPLALRQSEIIAAAIKHAAGAAVEIIGVSTRGDEITDRPLAEVGGKALFIKALQEAILDGRADAAAHSLKDMEAQPTPGFALAAVGFAADRRDALVTARGGGGGGLAELPAGSAVGTCSPRRAALLAGHYPALQTRPIRGNLQTRLAKLQAGEYDALLLAAAGLERLQLQQHISARLPPDVFIPAAGQGLLGVECAADNRALIKLLAVVNDEALHRIALAERAFAAAMEGDCHTALGARAEIRGGRIHLRAFYAGAGGALHYAAADDDDAAAAGRAAAAAIRRQAAR